MKRIILVMMICVMSLWSSDEITKAVFECSSKDVRSVMLSTITLEETAKELQATNQSYDFVLLMHSGCALMASEKIEDDGMRKGVLKRLQALREIYGVMIEVSEVSMQQFGIERADLPEYISTIKNPVSRAIKLQNQGYASVLLR